MNEIVITVPEWFSQLASHPMLLGALILGIWAQRTARWKECRQDIDKGGKKLRAKLFFNVLPWSVWMLMSIGLLAVYVYIQVR